MRYIDTTNLYNMQANWDLTHDEVWTQDPLKTEFKTYFHNKCWYTETKIVANDAHMDHFYPKGNNKQYGKYPFNNQDADNGYTWLKNKYENYHVACAYANRGKDEGGKKDYFPLCPHSPLLSQGVCNLNIEKPMLLNPTIQGDVKLLVFEENGEVVCSSSIELDEKRVAVSKTLYNLTHAELIGERTQVWHDTKESIDLFKYGTIQKTELIRQLKKFIDRDRWFSACAISCIRHCLVDNDPSDKQILDQLDLDL